MRVNWLPTVLVSALMGAATALALANARPFLSPAPIPALSPAVKPAPATKAPAASAAPAALPAEAVVQENRAGQAAAASGADDHGDPWPVALAGKWPLAFLLALILIAFSGRLRRIFGAGSKLVRKVSAGGVEMEISSEAVDQVRQQLKGSFRELVSNARDEYERMAYLQEVDQRLRAVFETRFRQLPNSDHMRTTVHVPDIIFQDYLYQLLDYYPRGEGAHRRFSQRYGIIGRSWRSNESHGTGDAFADAQGKEQALVEQWGMTRQEAHGKLKAKSSCLSVLLRANGIMVGILYLDSDLPDAFGITTAAQALAKELETDSLVNALCVAVGRTMAPLRAAAPNLDISKLG